MFAFYARFQMVMNEIRKNKKVLGNNMKCDGSDKKTLLTEDALLKFQY